MGTTHPSTLLDTFTTKGNCRLGTHLFQRYELVRGLPRCLNVSLRITQPRLERLRFTIHDALDTLCEIASQFVYL